VTATNHVVAGALIATVIHEPLLAVPIALLSHLVMDALPHFSWDEHTSKTFAKILLTDMACASAVLLTILMLHPANWVLLVTCGIAAASPDLLWGYHLAQELRGKPKPYSPVARFLIWIQWKELQSWTGFAIELAWLATTGVLLLGRV
jgi:hypothetical protein